MSGKHTIYIPKNVRKCLLKIPSPWIDRMKKAIDELETNMAEALNLFLDEPADSKLLLPFPKTGLRGKSIRAVSASPKVALAFYLRQLRLNHHMTQKEVAQKMGFKNIYSYYDRSYSFICI